MISVSVAMCWSGATLGGGGTPVLPMADLSMVFKKMDTTEEEAPRFKRTGPPPCLGMRG